MAHDPSHEHHANVDHASMGIEKEHPTWSTYWKVAVFLTAITVIEVWIYYTPFRENRLFVPSLLTMSAVRSGPGVLFYMPLRYHPRLFRALFPGRFTIAGFPLIGLIFLLGKLAIGVPH